MASLNWYQIGCYAQTAARAEHSVERLEKMQRAGNPTPVSGFKLAQLARAEHEEVS